MSYFDHKRNVKSYIKMMNGFDNAYILDAVYNSLKPGKKMLELGIGAGHDLAELIKSYTVAGSDRSQAFLDEYRKLDSETPLLKLDAVTLETQDTFDYIFSNKVLIHLSTPDLKKSLARQAQVLNSGGLVFHTFWKGQKQEKYHGMLFNYHMPADIGKMASEWFEPVRDVTYTEMKKDDSFYIVMRKK